nr:helix-turn-helix domain-containing protein [uncultured Novosphingobium sp.]
MSLKEGGKHEVAILALNGVLPFDLGIACEVFSHVHLADGSSPYRVRVCGESRRIDAGAFVFTPPCTLSGLADADTIIVAGIADPGRLVPAAVTEALRSAWMRGARLASICTGAFVLAATGLLDGQRATTHWRAAAELAQRFPSIMVEPNVLFIDEGRIVTSAGASAGIDMCLHLVGRDYGQAVAADAARLAVAPLHRDGGQAQFVRQAPTVVATSLAPLIDWMLAHLDERLDIETLAARACASPRTFARRFREQTGATPIQWLLAARVRRAQELLEASDAPIEQIAADAGFESPVTFRARFKRIVGVNPAAYRHRFAAGSASS